MNTTPVSTRDAEYTTYLHIIIFLKGKGGGEEKKNYPLDYYIFHTLECIFDENGGIVQNALMTLNPQKLAGLHLFARMPVKLNLSVRHLHLILLN